MSVLLPNGYVAFVIFLLLTSLLVQTYSRISEQTEEEFKNDTSYSPLTTTMVASSLINEHLAYHRTE